MIRHIRWQMALIVIGVLLLGGLMAYLASAFSTTQEPAPGGTYVEGLIGSPQFVNPLLCQYNDVDRDLCALVFSGLIRYDENGQPQPDLAERWDMSADGLVYTFHLRSNARWHDDRPVTAQDVVFTLGLLQDPNYPGSPDLAALWRTVQVVAVNDLTVQLTLQEPLTPFLQYLTIGLLPKHALPNVTAVDLADVAFNRQPIGSGPFQVEQLGTSETGQAPHVLLSAYPGYYGRQPFIGKIDFKLYPDYPTMLAAYRAGEIQGISHIPSDQLASVRDLTTLNLFTGRLASYTMLFMNQDDSGLPFFQSTDVRLALLLSLDRQRLIEEVLHGQGVLADSPIVPGTWAYAGDLPPVLPDQARARRLLNEAGWRFPSAERPAAAADDIDSRDLSTQLTRKDPNAIPVRFKDGVPISFTLYTTNDTLHVSLAKAIALQWQEVGVIATVVPVQAGLVSNYLAPRTYQAALVDVHLPNDPDPYSFWHETQATAPGQNYSQFKDRDVSEVLEQARRTADYTARRDLYRRFQELFSERVPGILIFYPLYTYGVSEKVADVQIGAIAYASDRFRTLPDWYVITRRVIVNNSPLIK